MSPAESRGPGHTRRRPRRSSRAAGPPGAQGSGRRGPHVEDAAAGRAGPDVPEQTRDDTDHGWGEASEPARDGHEDWLRRQRPPHWE
ncbi:hypothetical protein [Ornithinicoccus halotolerans]|uniref:hypothetical protein n=1 Tax=Ornithinicoccus halotolerans TaxID=1748220 RepID=UPI00129698E1|nr:hypothetical protein [Ornithinicoccus halotolerans]